MVLCQSRLQAPFSGMKPTTLRFCLFLSGFLGCSLGCWVLTGAHIRFPPGYGSGGHGPLQPLKEIKQGGPLAIVPTLRVKI